MQLKQPLSNLFYLDSDGFIICTGINYRTIIKPGPKYQQALQIFHKIVNGLGQLSATSQGLKQIITSINKFSGTNQRIYIKTVGSQAFGFVKTGQKNLFYHSFVGQVKQLKPICVLDIYVHESCQRSGFGKQIFQKFLLAEHTIPEKLAYDRPSPKLISFLRKHYQLTQFVPQNNNYVIFNKYFTTQLPPKPIINNLHTNRHHTETKKQKQNQSIQQQKLFPIFFPKHQSQPAVTTSAYTNEAKQNIIVDSLEIFKDQIEKSKNSNTFISPKQSISSQKLTRYQGGSYKNIDNYHIASKANIEANNRYSLNMKIKDLSFRVPWATSNNDVQKRQNTVNYNFRTTSNAYGNHYRN